jgi:hypothetical protein
MRDERRVVEEVEAWLRDADHPNPHDAIVDAVLAGLPARQVGRWGWSMQLSAVAAAMLVVAIGVGVLVGVRSLPDIGVPEPTAGPSRTPSPSPASFVRIPRYSVVDPGTYVVDDFFPVRVTLTLPAGWQKLNADGGSVIAVKPSSDHPPGWSASIQVWSVQAVFRDPCRSDLGTFDPGPTTRDLAVALAGLPGAEIAEPVEVEFAGWRGWYVETAEAITDTSRCHAGEWAWWDAPGALNSASTEEHEGLLGGWWILDVDGVRVLLSAPAFPDAPATDVRELAEILDSVQLEAATTTP